MNHNSSDVLVETIPTLNTHTCFGIWHGEESFATLINPFESNNYVDDGYWKERNMFDSIDYKHGGTCWRNLHEPENRNEVMKFGIEFKVRIFRIIHLFMISIPFDFCH